MRLHKNGGVQSIAVRLEANNEESHKYMAPCILPYSRAFSVT